MTDLTTAAGLRAWRAEWKAEWERQKTLIPDGWRWVGQLEWQGYAGSLLDKLTKADDLRMPEPGFWIRRKSSDEPRREANCLHS